MPRVGAQLARRGHGKSAAWCFLLALVILAVVLATTGARAEVEEEEAQGQAQVQVQEVETDAPVAEEVSEEPEVAEAVQEEEAEPEAAVDAATEEAGGAAADAEEPEAQQPETQEEAQEEVQEEVQEEDTAPVEDVQTPEPVHESEAAPEEQQQQQQVEEVEVEATPEPEAQQAVEEAVEEEVHPEAVEEAPEEVEPETTPEPTPEPVEQQQQQEVDTAAPKVIESGATVRWRARVLPEGCVGAVERYLVSVHEGRRAAAKAVTDARGHLNEVLVHHPKESDRAQAALDEATAALAALDKATAALAAYDEDTVRQYGGDLPKTCIEETDAFVETLPVPETKSDFIQCYSHFYRVLRSHAYLFSLLVQGEIAYLQRSYAPMLAEFRQMAATFDEKSKAFFNEAHPKPGLLDKLTGKQKEVPVAEFLTKTAQGLAYGCVPLLMMGAIAVVLVIAAPAVAAVVLLSDTLYAVYLKLFVFQYAYGMIFPREFITAATNAVAHAQAGRWDIVGDNALDAFFDIAGEPDGIYNGMIMAFLASGILVFTVVGIVTWLKCCCFGRGSKSSSSKKSAGRSSTSSSSSSSKKGKKKEAKPTAAPVEAAAKSSKKKN